LGGGGSLFFLEEKDDGVHAGVSFIGVLLDGLKGGHLVGDALL
jgi:hypothetical protein